MSKPKNHSQHYTQQSFESEDLHLLELQISEVLKPSLYHKKYLAKLNKFNDSSNCGSLLVNLSKEDSINLIPGETLLINSSLKLINAPKNPSQFNYKNYMDLQGVYHQVYLESTQILKSEIESNLLNRAFNLREKIKKSLISNNIKGDELAVINALLLRERNDISSDLYESYAKAGAIHILAISGLHIGIILLMVQSILKPLDLHYRTRKFKLIIILCILWSFAFIAGASSSILRAVGMFSVFAVSMNIKRKSFTLNSLFVSAFLLLLFDPQLLYGIGFQMSYMAVLSILFLMPLFESFYNPKNYILKKIWQIIAVSVAAQLGVFPISLLYFHQFPGLFLITNLIILPFLGILLGLGFIVLFLAYFNLLIPEIASIYSFLINQLNAFVNWTAAQEAFLFENISFSPFQMLICYALIISFFLWIHFKKIRFLKISLCSILFFQAYDFYNTRNKTETSFVVFQKSKQTILGFSVSHHLLIHSSDSIQNLKHNNMLKAFMISNRIKSTFFDDVQYSYKIGERNLIVIDSFGIYSADKKPQLILLRNSPRINLNRLIDSIQPEQIIADGSNYTSFAKRWKASCEAKKIPFHHTSERGAFIIKY